MLYFFAKSRTDFLDFGQKKYLLSLFLPKAVLVVFIFAKSSTDCLYF